MIKIKKSDRNTNKHTEDGMQLLEKSISNVGAIESISVTQEGTIISGHARKETFDKLGMTPVEVNIADNEYPVIIRNDINDNTKKYFEAQILANTTAKKNINLDHDLISEIVEEYDIDIEDVGVDAFESEEIPEAEEDDFDPTPPAMPKTVLGDLYEIGRHRLLCGDSTDSDAVAKLMNGEKADMVFTDPPYEIDFNYSNTLLFSSDCHVFIFNNDRALIRQIQESPLEFKKFFVFHHSGTAIPQEGGNEVFLDHVLVSHEINGKPKVRYNKGNGTRSVIKGEYRRSEEHKHQKPFSFLSPIIQGYSNVGFIILDFFSGGGSLFGAAHQLKRKCYGMELDPKYCDVIVNRMLKLDNNLTVKRNGVDVTKEFLTNE